MLTHSSKHTHADKCTHANRSQNTGVIYSIISSGESVAVILDGIFIINSIYVKLNIANKINTGTHILVIKSARPHEGAPANVRFAS